MSRNAVLWIVWTVLTLFGGGAVAALIFVAGDRSPLLIGETTGVHHQFETSCETCHAAGPFVTARKAEKALNKTCQDCHKAELKESDDSHPTTKFRNPRMADYWAKVDVRLCTACHIEHRPEITRPGAVTLAMNYCVACHSEGERDVRKNRESHAGLGYDSCASAGCHNFHDNRALYEDFLVKRSGGPWVAEKPLHALTAKLRAATEAPQPEPALAVAPAEELAKGKVHTDWARSAHATNAVNCGACHVGEAWKDGMALAQVEAAWTGTPDTTACRACHRQQAKSFVSGRHGMRGHREIAKPRRVERGLKALGLDAAVPETLVAIVEDPAPPPRMTVAEARLPMRQDAHGRTLDCGSCHGPHDVDLRHAAVDACLGCHADDHSVAYRESPHFERWRAELAGEAPAGAGVSCATCHMPKEKAGQSARTNHNQNDVLRPNEKMIRPVCLDCHSLDFAIDALADADLVARNFTGRPSAHIPSIDWALRRVKADGKGANQ